MLHGDSRDLLDFNYFIAGDAPSNGESVETNHSYGREVVETLEEKIRTLAE
jgi:hypothetical protein